MKIRTWNGTSQYLQTFALNVAFAHLSSRGTVDRCCFQWHHILLSGGCREEAPAANMSQEVVCVCVSECVFCSSLAPCSGFWDDAKNDLFSVVLFRSADALNNIFASEKCSLTSKCLKHFSVFFFSACSQLLLFVHSFSAVKKKKKKRVTFALWSVCVGQCGTEHQSAQCGRTDWKQKGEQVKSLILLSSH